LFRKQRHNRGINTADFWVQLQLPEHVWPFALTQPQINMGSSCLFPAIHCSVWLPRAVSNPTTEIALCLTPACTKHLAPSESDPEHMLVAPHGLVPCQSSHLTEQPPLPSSIYSRSSGLQTPSLAASQTKHCKPKHSSPASSKTGKKKP